VTTRWEATGQEITERLRETREERYRRARAILDEYLERIERGGPLRDRAPATPVTRAHHPQLSIPRAVARVRRAASPPPPVTAAPSLPNRLAAWERGRRELETWLVDTVARAPSVYVSPTPPSVGGTAPGSHLPWETPAPTYWSPTPILGYRAWRVMKTGVNGAVKRWKSPSYDAGCVAYGMREVRDDEVPHTNGECASPHCGIYALKDAQDLRPPQQHGWNAFGLVELSGKVVEHEIGYRAGRATAIAVVVRVDSTLYQFIGADQVGRLFRLGERAFPGAHSSVSPSPNRHQTIVDFLEEMRLVYEATRVGD
jgi:hypothetical protein